MDADAGKGDDGVALFKLAEITLQALVHGLERIQPLVPVHDAFLAEPGTQVLDEVNHPLLSAEMHLLGLDAEEGLGPGPATLVVGNHLDLVDDGNIDLGVQRCHLDGAAVKPIVGVVGDPQLLARDESTRLVLGLEAVPDLVGQQAQRSSIDTSL